LHQNRLILFGKMIFLAFIIIKWLLMNKTGIKFRHLQIFIEVARQKSVGRAADILAISQPAVTKTIRELEEILGVKLFEKEGRGIKLGRIGEVFLRHAGASVAAVLQGVDSVNQALLHSAPPVRIGALPTVSARVMPDAIKLYLKENVGSEIKIVTGENSVLLEQLRGAELDLVVGRLAAPEKMTGLSFEHLYSEQVVFAVRTSHPMLESTNFRLDDLRNYTILLPTKASVIRPFVERFSWPTAFQNFLFKLKRFLTVLGAPLFVPATASGLSQKA